MPRCVPSSCGLWRWSPCHPLSACTRSLAAVVLQGPSMSPHMNFMVLIKLTKALGVKGPRQAMDEEPTEQSISLLRGDLNLGWWFAHLPAHLLSFGVA